MKQGVLLLSHCGFSFIEDLARSVAQRGLERYILSSRPTAAPEERLRSLAQHGEWLGATDAHELLQADVAAALRALRERGVEVLGCLSVWEGYRALSAWANALLGAPDVRVEQVELLRDKLRLRQTLHALGLSDIRAEALTRESLPRLRKSGRRLFVKPLTGIASYGAFELRPETTWERIEAIAQASESDTVYRSILGAQTRFIAEDFISGVECSFEVLCVDGKRFTAAVHEKVALSSRDLTTLEDACASPPWNLDRAALGAGVRRVDEIFEALSLDWGCYHVEARLDGSRWELIEINPRVGGALISPSVRELTGGRDLLDLWVGALLAGDAQARRAILDELEALAISPEGEVPGTRATFFRVYFARPGRIADVHVRSVDPEPLKTQIFLQAGEAVREDAREVFLGQALWSYPRARAPRALLESSKNLVAVSYEEAGRNVA